MAYNPDYTPDAQSGGPSPDSHSAGDRSESFHWGGTTFGPGGTHSRAEFSRFLDAHHSNFQRWVNNHPAAAQRVFGVAPAPGTGRTRPE